MFATDVSDPSSVLNVNLLLVIFSYVLLKLKNLPVFQNFFGTDSLRQTVRHCRWRAAVLKLLLFESQIQWSQGHSLRTVCLAWPNQNHVPASSSFLGRRQLMSMVPNFSGDSRQQCTLVTVSCQWQIDRQFSSWTLLVFCSPFLTVFTSLFTSIFTSKHVCSANNSASTGKTKICMCSQNGSRKRLTIYPMRTNRLSPYVVITHTVITYLYGGNFCGGKSYCTLWPYKIHEVMNIYMYGDYSHIKIVSSRNVLQHMVITKWESDISESFSQFPKSKASVRLIWQNVFLKSCHSSSSNNPIQSSLVVQFRMTFRSEVNCTTVWIFQAEFLLVNYLNNLKIIFGPFWKWVSRVNLTYQ